MRLLLDSHSFIWWVAGSARLSAAAQQAIANEANTVSLSTASIWEISIKRRLGRLRRDEFNHDSPLAAARLQGFDVLSIGPSHAESAAALPLHHADPFDRMLIAQARLEGLALVSNERIFDKYDVERVW